MSISSISVFNSHIQGISWTYTVKDKVSSTTLELGVIPINLAAFRGVPPYRAVLREDDEAKENLSPPRTVTLMSQAPLPTKSQLHEASALPRWAHA